jgi:phosphoribosylanthranilate isomerase
MTKVKICGITNLQDALSAIKYGADALGFVFFNKSPRYISPIEARDIINQLPPLIKTVGLFVNHSREDILSIVAETGIDIIQLHGDESPNFCEKLGHKYIRAIRVKSQSDIVTANEQYLSASGLLLDSYNKHIYGGTGEAFLWDMIPDKSICSKPLIIAGGLNPNNVGTLVKKYKPYAVDVSSGVEKEKGIKDADLIKQFCEQAKCF